MKEINYSAKLVACVCFVALGLAGCKKEEPSAEGKLTVTPENLELSFAGDTETVRVAGNGWTAVSEAEWITIDQAAGRFTVTVGPNETEGVLEGEITVANSVDTKTVTVTQAADPNAISADPDELLVTFEGAAQTVIVSSALTWAVEVTSGKEWFTATKTGDDRFSVRATRNDGDEPRSGSLVIDNGEHQRVIPITQEEHLGFELPASADHYYATETSTVMLFNMIDAEEPEPPHMFKGDGHYLCFYISMPMVNYEYASLDIAPGTYTFTADSDHEGDFKAECVYFNRITDSALGEKLPMTEGTIDVSGDHTGYLIKVDATLEDGTRFRAFSRGAFNVENPNVLTSIYEDYRMEPLTQGGIGFRGDVIGNGTHAWALEMWSAGIYQQGDYLEGNGNMVQMMLVSDQSGDGSVLPDGTYELLDLENDGYGEFTAISGFGEWGYGSWMNEMTDGRIPSSGVAPLYKGTITSSYDPETESYTIEIDAEDDAHNAVTGSFEGELEWWLVPENPVTRASEGVRAAIPARAKYRNR
ncbi:MAG: BACON domain-containing protein [Alistipes sp.]|jgi:hypothetical protein|nr:BACON domain-containing protein [Alistipes sp.]